jgi:thiol-disulfide isomerase/thioredoxin
MSLLRKTDTRWSLVFVCALIMAVAISAVSVAQDEKKEAADEPKADIAAEAESVDDLLKGLADVDRDLRVVIRDIQRGAADLAEGEKVKLSDEQRKELAEAVEGIVKAGDKIASAKTATQPQIERAQTIVARTLSTAAELAGEEYEKRFDAYVDQLIKEQPESSATEYGVAQRFFSRHLSGEPKPEALDDLLKFHEQFPKNAQTVLLFRVLGSRWSQAGEVERAIEVYEKGMELFGETRSAEYLKRPLRDLAMIGKPMEIKGPSPDGHHIDLAEMKGKVVLIDFWGTWCGPCVGEIPNIKKVYEKHHDAGFEVIGVNVGDDKETLAKFLKENEVAWPQIQFVDDKGKEQPNKVAQQYEINSFPSTYLIGRDGNVIAVDVRGDALEKQVDKHIQVAGN